MIKNYKGNAEANGKWLVVEERFECDGVEWVVMHKQHESGYLNLKVAADGRAPKKANYWFSYKLDDGAYFGRDFLVLKANRPLLCNFVEGVILKLLSDNVFINIIERTATSN